MLESHGRWIARSLWVRSDLLCSEARILRFGGDAWILSECIPSTKGEKGGEDDHAPCWVACHLSYAENFNHSPLHFIPRVEVRGEVHEVVFQAMVIHGVGSRGVYVPINAIRFSY